jgi:SAM-dependent methyltransferase
MPIAKQAAVDFALRWQSADAEHTDRLYFEKVNFWRDFFPGTLGEQLAALPAGTAAAQSFPAGELVPAWSEMNLHRVRPGQIRLVLRTGQAITPRTGRFYPRGMVAGLTDVFSGDRRPFRYLGEADGYAGVDLNHPLARYPLTVEGRVLADLGTGSEHGGRSHDIPYDLTDNGPGMQVPHPQVATDYTSEEPFARLDERSDALFYREPRLVQHLDAQVRGQIAELYARVLRPGMRVLDLMSSWVSHLPEPLDLDVTGLGLNAVELEQNPRLASRTVHDLNATPELTWPDAYFDAVVCTASVEYLVKPLDVFRAVRRVLKPGAPFVLTFSERWFPPKVIQLWPAIHPFERMGLVLNYFRQSGGFSALGTESARGWLRPEDDKYAGQFPYADPLYAVWGRAA